jgi:hypothetical protein
MSYWRAWPACLMPACWYTAIWALALIVKVGASGDTVTYLSTAESACSNTAFDCPYFLSVVPTCPYRRGYNFGNGHLISDAFTWAPPDVKHTGKKGTRAVRWHYRSARPECMGSGFRYVLHPFAAKYSHWMWH